MSETETASAEAIWHDVECGAYAADLPLWRRLASEAAGPVLELGAGTGRVALALARQGFEVTALEQSPALAAALGERAAARGLDITVIEGDALELEAAGEFALILAPMQFAHLFDGAGRARIYERCAAALAPGGALALAVLAERVGIAAADPPPLPDVREVGGWVYSSQPIEVRELADGALEVRRLRQLVSPEGSLSDSLERVRLERLSAAELESEASAAGLLARERIDVPPTDDHVGSSVVVLEAG